VLGPVQQPLNVNGNREKQSWCGGLGIEIGVRRGHSGVVRSECVTGFKKELLK
jgi:hypothetical protein